MHELYQEEHANNQPKQVKLKYYRDVFNTEFNLSFHKPKKDVCNVCFSYNNSSEQEQLEKQDEYDNHHSRKTRVRQLKAEYKALAKDDKSIRAVTFDLA
ncbi:hypothetical protein SNE40_002795 [Patella caerulea]|uniref:Uncharacterized protein n=1 Tax=Patella caerulea TaxID=87958 RepID=A0AAN8K6V2_PATCE